MTPAVVAALPRPTTTLGQQQTADRPAIQQAIAGALQGMAPVPQTPTLPPTWGPYDRKSAQNNERDDVGNAYGDKHFGQALKAGWGVLTGQGAPAPGSAQTVPTPLPAPAATPARPANGPMASLPAVETAGGAAPAATTERGVANRADAILTAWPDIKEGVKDFVGGIGWRGAPAANIRPAAPGAVPLLPPETRAVNLRQPPAPPVASGPAVTFSPAVAAALAPLDKIQEFGKPAVPHLMSGQDYQRALGGTNQTSVTFTPEVAQTLGKAPLPPAPVSGQPSATITRENSPESDARYKRDLEAAGGRVVTGPDGSPNYVMPPSGPITAQGLARQVAAMGGPNWDAISPENLAKAAKPGYAPAPKQDWYNGIDVSQMSPSEYMALKALTGQDANDLAAAKQFYALAPNERGRAPASVQRAMAPGPSPVTQFGMAVENRTRGAQAEGQKLTTELQKAAITAGGKDAEAQARRATSQDQALLRQVTALNNGLAPEDERRLDTDQQMFMVQVISAANADRAARGQPPLSHAQAIPAAYQYANQWDSPSRILRRLKADPATAKLPEEKLKQLASEQAELGRQKQLASMMAPAGRG